MTETMGLAELKSRRAIRLPVTVYLLELAVLTQARGRAGTDADDEGDARKPA